jgi:hypothetical protein
MLEEETLPRYLLPIEDITTEIAPLPDAYAETYLISDFWYG